MVQPSSHSTPITHARNAWRMKVAAGVVACSLALGAGVSVAYGVEGDSYTVPDSTPQPSQSAQSAAIDEKIARKERANLHKRRLPPSRESTCLKP